MMELEDDSVVEDLGEGPRTVEEELQNFLGSYFFVGWDDYYGREEESIANALRKRPLAEMERVLTAFDEVLRRDYSEEELQAYFARVSCHYYPPGVGKTHIEWFQWVRDEVARGVEHKRRACQSLSERADSKLIARKIVEGLPREQRDPTFQNAGDWMGGLFFRNWRRMYKDVDELIDEDVAKRSTEQLATVLEELEAFLQRQYTEDELEYLVHTVLACSQFDPVPGATYTEALEWTRGRLRAALDQKRAGGGNQTA